MSSKSQFTWLQQIGSNQIKLNEIISGIESNGTVFTLVNRPSLVVLSVAQVTVATLVVCSSHTVVVLFDVFSLSYGDTCSRMSFFCCSALDIIVIYRCLQYRMLIFSWKSPQSMKFYKKLCYFSFICFLYTPWGRKKEPIFVCVHFLMLDRNWWIFFTCIKESISYNYVYLILACANNFV